MPVINWSLIAPEVIVCAAAVLVMLVDAFTRPTQRWVTGGISLIGLVTAAVASVCLWINGTPAPDAFNGMIVLDELRLGFTLVFLLVSALTLLISTVWVHGENLPAGEFHSLLLFATVGMMLMASGNDLVIIFLGLEILSIATYVMAGFRRTDVRSNELIISTGWTSCTNHPRAVSQLALESFQRSPANDRETRAGKLP